MAHHLLLDLSGFFNKGLLVTLIIGFIGGLLAQLVTPGRGFGIITSIIIGIAGGWLANKFFGGFLNFNVGIPYFNEVVRAIAGAIVLVLIINLIVGKGKEDKTGWRA